MDLDSIVMARIHPAIGIARVGNAEPGDNGDDYFIGPEVPNAISAPDGGYRDAQGRLKRQAARFRIYGYDRDGRVVGELTDEVAEIEWRVHVANRKAAWYNFDVALDLPEAKGVRSPRRNAQIQGPDRANLSIDPGERKVCRRTPKAHFDTGAFFGVPVYLGEIRYVERGRLLFLGGRGKSAPVSPEYSLTTFANNSGWHDDTSDGPVKATVRIGRRELPVDPAWVVTAPPNYAPDLVATQPLYDVILDAIEWMVSPDPVTSFTRHILPIFRQFRDSQWVNAGFAALFGSHGLTDFTRPEFIEKLATAPVKRPNGTFDPFQELRRQIFLAFRDPDSKVFEPLRWPPLYGDAFFFMDDPPSPKVAFTITGRSYARLRNWMQGDFAADYNASAREPESLEEVPVAEQPDVLDHAALHFCVGGPFHPGCEMTWPMRHCSMYRSKFRLRERLPDVLEPNYGDFMTPELATADGGPLSASGPGDITKWLAVPWQTDTASCLAGYSGTEFPVDDLIPAFWPSRVPNTVLTEESYRVVVDETKILSERLEAFHHRESWIQNLHPASPYLSQLASMIDHFHHLGTVERRERHLGDEFPSVMYVQNLPRAKKDAPAQPQVSNRTSHIAALFQARVRRGQRKA
jgi:L-Lysine epsilon oxidase N-terminal/L-lysine epsilon oxidase C-terminal domain